MTNNFINGTREFIVTFKNKTGMKLFNQKYKIKTVDKFDV